MDDSFSYVGSFVHDLLVTSECWFGQKRVFFSKNRLFTPKPIRIHQWVIGNDSYTNYSTYENESTICWSRPIREEIFTGATYAKNIKTIEYIFHSFQ